MEPTDKGTESEVPVLSWPRLVHNNFGVSAQKFPLARVQSHPHAERIIDPEVFERLEHIGHGIKLPAWMSSSVRAPAHSSEQQVPRFFYFGERCEKPLVPALQAKPPGKLTDLTAPRTGMSAICSAVRFEELCLGENLVDFQ